MIEAFKLHWFAFRHPTRLVSEHIPAWPVDLGVGIYLLYFCGQFFGSAANRRIFSDMTAAMFGITAPSFFYAYILFTIVYTLVMQYYLQPVIVRKVGRIEKENFDEDLYRRIIFYSPVAAVIYNVLVMLPVQLAAAYLLVDGEVTVLSMAFIGLQSIVGIWATILLVNMFVIQWRGLKIHFHLTAGQIMLSMFVIPFAIASPVLLLMGKAYLSALHAYMQ